MTIRFAAALAGLAAFAYAQPVVAQPVVAKLPGTQGEALRLAEALLPTEQLLALRLPRFKASYAEELATDAEVAALEKRYPGVTKAIAAAAREEAAAGYRTAIGLLRDDAAKLYASRVNAADTAALVRFFSSNVGRMLVTLSAGSAGDTPTSFEADRRRKAIEALRNLGPEGQRELMALQTSGLADRMKALAPDVAALSARRFGDVDTLIRARLPASRTRAVAAFPAPSAKR